MALLTVFYFEILEVTFWFADILALSILLHSPFLRLTSLGSIIEIWLVHRLVVALMLILKGLRFTFLVCWVHLMVIALILVLVWSWILRSYYDLIFGLVKLRMVDMDDFS